MSSCSHNVAGSLLIRVAPLLGACLAAFGLLAGNAFADAPVAAVADGPDQYAALATSLAELIRDAIPPSYEKRKDWDAKKTIAVGVRRDDGLHFSPRKKEVNHGVWKHYKVELLQPEKNLVVRVEDLAARPGGRAVMTIVVEAKLDVWARARVFEYGVHVISLELAADADVRFTLHGDVGVKFAAVDGQPVLALDPHVADATIDFQRLRIRRISDARGPLVKQLGDGVGRMIEEELSGERLAGKLNRAIDKKRDRLRIPLDAAVLPLASLVGEGLNKPRQ